MNRFLRFRRRRDARKQRPACMRLELEPLEARNLLNAAPTNVLVNNPAEDTIPMQDTQSESAIVLGADSNVVTTMNEVRRSESTRSTALARCTNPLYIDWKRMKNSATSSRNAEPRIRSATV